MTILLQEKPGPARPDIHGLLATFGSLGVPAPLVAPVDAAGITVPFPIQAATLPDALAGRAGAGGDAGAARRIWRGGSQGAKPALALISGPQQGRRLDTTPP